MKKKSQKIIKDDKGQWAHPGKITQINSNQITMKGVPYPVLGISDTGQKIIMQPEQDYLFSGSKVTEYPLTEQSMGQKKKLNQLTDFSNPPKAKKGTRIKKAQVGINSLYQVPDSQSVSMDWMQNSQPFISPQKQTIGKNIASNLSGAFGGLAGGVGNVLGASSSQQGLLPASNLLDKIGGAQGLIGIADNVMGAVGQINAEKDRKRAAKQDAELSGVVRQAAESRPEKVKRKYVRPEDALVQPGEMYSPLGQGTNYLAKNGAQVQNTYSPGTLYDNLSYEPLNESDIKQYQLGGIVGNLGGVLGSAIGGGKGAQTGAGMLGSTIGGTAGMFFGPAGSMIGSALGGLVGGIFGGKQAKQTQKYLDQAQGNRDAIMAQQIGQATQNQYSSFMRTGGNLRTNELAMGGDIQTYWGGKAEPISYNPYLPDEGETVMFKGQSHDESNGKGQSGIGVGFGNKTVEVERGEPAVKLEHGGGENLVVFGDMKIPSYGVAEIGDPKAKNKKFKSYIADLSKKEAKQNKLSDKAIKTINETEIKDSFDKLKLTTNEAILTGVDMKLKDIANKKQKASIVQKAILDTAEEYGLQSDELAKGKIKKAKNGGKFNSYQSGGIMGPVYANIDPRSTPEMQKKNMQMNLAEALRFKNLLTGSDKTLVPSGDYLNQIEGAVPQQQVGGGSRNYAYVDPKAITKADSVINTTRPILFPKQSKGFKQGGLLPIAQNGDAFSITSDKVSEYTDFYGWELDPENPGRLRRETKIPGETKTIESGKYKAGSADFQKAYAKAKKAGLSQFDYKGKPIKVEDWKPSTQTVSTPDRSEWDYIDIVDPNSIPTVNTVPTTGTQTTPSEVNTNKGEWMDLLGAALPYLRPRTKLDRPDLSPEYFAMATNQLEPVQAQLYNPLLQQVSDISLQDQLNLNQADFNALKKISSNNPEVLAQLAAQKYQANTGVLGEQFRLNQGQKQNVYNQNRQTLNDAQLKNLSILDQQYTRQTQSKANTKATTQAALNSISDKIAKQKLEEKTLNVYENLYNYRYDNQGRAWNMNAPFNPYIPQVSETPEEPQKKKAKNGYIVKALKKY